MSKFKDTEIYIAAKACTFISKLLPKSEKVRVMVSEKNETTIACLRDSDYQKFLMTFGIDVLLALLEYFQDETVEKYEECQKIVDLIKKTNREVGLNLPTRFQQGGVKREAAMVH